MMFVRFVWSDNCTSEKYQNALADDANVIIDRLPNDANTNVDFKLDGKPMNPGITGVTLDFLDIAVLIYLADEMVKRKAQGDFWTRTMPCLIPVMHPDKWSSNEKLLQDTLSKLSGDMWQFDWLKLEHSPSLTPHRLALPTGCETVCLFSGGIDSLLGAVRLLEEGRKVILVGHQADGQTASSQTDLAEMLRQKYPNQLNFVQCSVSRSPRRNPFYSLADKTEITHRVRSFLFLALAVSIAVKSVIEEIFMPENGFMALNVPLQKSRLGTLSTRTAHPSFILRFIDLSKVVMGFTGSIKNPFLMQSKTDMLNNIDASFHPLLLRSISCARPNRYNNRGVRHCGYCIPCIHRRIALMEANIDTAGDYAEDVFQNLHNLDNAKQLDFRALVKFAHHICEASEAELQTLVLKHGYFPSDIGNMISVECTTSYKPWTEMLQRWANNFNRKINDNASVRTLKALGIQ